MGHPFFVVGEERSGKLYYGDHDDDRRKDHQVGIEQDENSGVVKAPFALKAAGRLRHAPDGNQQSKDLPVRAVNIFDAGKAGKAQAGGKCPHREQDGANQRFLPQAKDREEEMHNLSMYSRGRCTAAALYRGGCRGGMGGAARRACCRRLRGLGRRSA